MVLALSGRAGATNTRKGGEQADQPQQSYPADPEILRMKAYLRYIPTDSFGVIVSPQCPDLLTDPSGKLAITAALQDVCVFNLRQGTKIRTLRPPGPTLEDTCTEIPKVGEVTSMALAPGGVHLAVGYFSGVINVFDLSTGALVVTLHGHKAAVTCLQYNRSGTTLASGSRDTAVIVWDVITESGLFRLKGHKDSVTGLRFLEKEGGGGAEYLVTVSKDALAKVWDLSTQHCTQTLTGHRAEVWSVAVNRQGTRIITGAADRQLRVWSVREEAGGEQEEEEGGLAEYMGSVVREGNDRCLAVKFDARERLVAAQDGGRVVDVYLVRDEAEARKKMKRRHKRQREKAKHRADKAAAGSEVGGHEEEEGERAGEGMAASDELELVVTLTAGHKVRSVTFLPEPSPDKARVLLGLGNNCLEVHSVDLTTKATSKTHTLDALGHRSDVRAVALSSDDELLASTSGNGQLKIWGTRGGRQCIRTCAGVGFGLCLAFLPGDRHVVVGCKEGKLHLVDLASGDIIETHDDAHGGAIWSLDVRPDGKGVMTGSADHEVKFWELEMAEGRLSLVHTRTLKMSDDVLAVRYSRTKDPERLLVAVALLDSTVKVFYENSLRFFLSLYGHKLPVMALDISDDNELIATASADKTVKIWGLDFGDCHRSLMAHSDSVMGLRFIPGTHCFLSCGKDKAIKYWDADHFEHVMTLPGHQGEVWGMAMASDGSFFATCSHDRSLRLWERTDDQVFVDEERERELEQLFEADLEKPTATATQAAGENGEAAEGEEESGSASRRTLDSVKSADRLEEALQLAAADDALLKQNPQRLANPIMLGLPSHRYILHILRGIKAPELEQALLVLPLDLAQRLLGYLVRLLGQGLETELCWRCAVFLLRVYNAQVVANRALIGTLTKMRGPLRAQLAQHRDLMGFNAAGLKMLKRELEADRNARIDDEQQAAAPLLAAPGVAAAQNGGAKKAKR